MNPYNTIRSFARSRLVLLLLGLATVIFSVYMVISAIFIAQTTGVLHLSSTNSKARLVVSQNNAQAVDIGKGKSSIRLKPGAYQVSARYNGYRTVARIQIRKRQTTETVLNLVTTNATPSSSLYGTAIQNTSELNNLLLPEQFSSVLKTTSDYIINHVDSDAQSATIISTTLNQDGSISYTVQTNTNPVSRVKVILQKQLDGVIVFVVPASGFSITLNPY